MLIKTSLSLIRTKSALEHSHKDNPCYRRWPIEFRGRILQSKFRGDMRGRRFEQEPPLSIPARCLSTLVGRTAKSGRELLFLTTSCLVLRRGGFTRLFPSNAIVSLVKKTMSTTPPGAERLDRCVTCGRQLQRRGWLSIFFSRLLPAQSILTR